MGAFVKTTKVCAVAALGLGLSLGIAVSGDPSIASAAVAEQAEATSVVVTSPTEIDADQPFDIAGTAKPGSTVSIYGLEDRFEVSVPVDADGDFEYRTTRGLRAGVRPVEFYVGLERTSVEYRVRGADGTVPVLRPLVVDAPSYVPGQKLTLTGSGTPDARIDVRAGTAGIGGSDVEVGEDGKWSFTSQYVVTGLSHVVKVYQRNGLGTQSKTLQITGDESAFAPLTVDAPSYVPGQKLTLTGSGTPGARIDVRAGTAGIGGSDVEVGEDGKWSFTSQYVVTGLSHVVKVYQRNGLGTQSKTLQLEAFDENGDRPVFRALALTSDPTFVPGGTTTLAGRATSWAQVRVTLTNPGGKRVPGASSVTHSVLARADGSWSVEIPSHRLIHAKVQQHSELGNDSIEFDFDKA